MCIAELAKFGTLGYVAFLSGLTASLGINVVQASGFVAKRSQGT